MIPEFLENKEVFITGGSGVVGSALIELLLRCCNVRKIYVLLRPKRTAPFEERLDKLKAKPIFSKVKIVKPNELDKKLVAIPGDATLPFLGITEHWAKLMENVSIVFHCAATVRFDEPLKNAITLNVGGTLEAIRFAETLKKLKIFMHVSTYFSNPYLKYTESKVYEPPMDWKLCLKLAEGDDLCEENVNIITRKLITGFPNTYTFTKNLAESLVNDYRHKLPVCIFRPSIVMFSLEEPEPGFHPSLTGVMGIYAVIGAGLLKSIYLDPKVRVDCTPQDVCAKLMLYYALKASQLYEKVTPSEIPIYLVSSTNVSDVTFEQLSNEGYQFGFWEKNAFEKSFLLPGHHCTSNRFIYMFLVIFKQVIPALLVDVILKLLGRKPVLLRAQRKLFNTLEVMKPFSFNNFDSPGVTNLDEITTDLHGTDFNIDGATKCNDLFYKAQLADNTIRCARYILLKEDPKTLPRSRKIFKIKAWAYRCVQLYVAYKLYLKTVDYGSSWFSDWQQNAVDSAI